MATKRTSRAKSFSVDVGGSKALYDVRWNGKTKELAVTFVKDGSQYVYSDVPKSIAKQIDSGEAFNDLVRDEYDYV